MYTSWPFIWIGLKPPTWALRPPSRGWCRSTWARVRQLLRLPSERIRKATRPSSSAGQASRATAPAPSPNSTQVRRSSQSSQRLSWSAPMTSTRSMAPLRRYWAAVIRAKRKPLQAAVRSKATALEAPRAACTLGAVPKRSSGLEVASRIMSRSAGRQPACSRAARPAAAARLVTVSPGPATLRAPMPVRLRIQASSVVTRWLRSSLLMLAAGRARPLPTRAMPLAAPAWDGMGPRGSGMGGVAGEGSTNALSEGSDTGIHPHSASVNHRWPPPPRWSPGGLRSHRLPGPRPRHPERGGRPSRRGWRPNG